MANVMPTNSPPSQSPRVAPYTTATTSARASPITATRRTTRRVSRCVRVCSSSRPARACPIRPISVRAPVASTRARPFPCTTSVPEKTKGESSPPGRDISAMVPGADVFATETDSPVSKDSSTARFVPDKTTASAGTRSPSLRMIASSRTTSRPAIRFCCPPRTTKARGLDRSRNASRARSVLRCWYKVRPITTNTKPRSIDASLASPSSRYTAPQAISNKKIGSLTTENAIARRLRGFAEGSSFGPSSSNRRRASTSLRPVEVSTERRLVISVNDAT